MFWEDTEWNVESGINDWINLDLILKYVNSPVCMNLQRYKFCQTFLQTWIDCGSSGFSYD